MSWAASEVIQIYLGTTRVAVAGHDASSPAEEHWLAADSPLDGLRKVLVLLDARRAGWRRPRLAISLSGALAPPFFLEPVSGLVHIREAQEVVAHMALEATGLEGPCDVWLDAWAPQRPCLCVAMDRSLRGAIESACRRSGARLVALRPWWTLAFNHALDRGRGADALVLAHDTDAATVLIGGTGALISAASHSPVPGTLALRDLTVRALLTSNLDPGRAIRVAMRERHGVAAEPAPDGPPFSSPLEAIS